MRTIRVLASFGSVSADTSATTVGPHDYNVRYATLNPSCIWSPV